MNSSRGLMLPTLYAIDEKDASLERQPWFLPFEPAAAVGGGASATVDYTQPWMDFVCTGIGFTSGTVGFPAAPGRWKVSVQDVGAQKSWQPQTFDITAVVGGNFGVSDSSYVDLPVPWLFLEKTTIRVQFENRDPALACLPDLVLVGYLTDWEREAESSIARQSLELKALQRQAGMQTVSRTGREY